MRNALTHDTHRVRVRCLGRLGKNAIPKLLIHWEKIPETFGLSTRMASREHTLQFILKNCCAGPYFRRQGLGMLFLIRLSVAGPLLLWRKDWAGTFWDATSIMSM